ncbi:MAG: aminoacyl-tRNA hydrolase [Lachnospiraceae bacterium]|jgi:PTH1 family peptidyl-tRNA hydrolase|nr:aminoacyl-tRNA hydrolase [Lachnospiraceae bacterium]
MYLIAGLGNPGREYEHTRHNCGFDVIDILSQKLMIPVSGREHKAFVGKGYYEGNKILLVKPLTYMNKSGESLRELTDYYNIDPETELIVLYDDIDLDPGQLRIRKSGSPGGHNGMKNIVALLGTRDFTRVRIGVGAKPAGWDLADYVLGHFSGQDREAVLQAFEEAADAVLTILTEGADKAMNRVNAKKKTENA